MRNQYIIAMLAAVAAFVGAGSLSAQTSTNLVYGNTEGSYTYYARGQEGAALDEFTVAFYPGSYSGSKDGGLTWNQSFVSSDAGSISFASGELSNNVTDPSTEFVAGFQGVTEYAGGVNGDNGFGYYDILFDLGGSYVVTEVVITYNDGATYRWATGTNDYPTSIYTASSMPTSDADLTLFGDPAKAAANSTGTITFSEAGGVTAQYLDIRAGVYSTYADLNPASSDNRGGKITEVAIYGYAAVPEPSTYALFFGFGAFLFVGIRAWKRK
ncbi:PEP-CTERM sorting domain-containing protein [Coraliomargarita parva]|uniref:PEP-CTERM sorting domain-containing protein n=1 Tax=Coraliomargarita parva TaxID=3014050 RepID=UPI0022B3CDD0|nr:PEP-CTERM sorting domain-containing protein [Coraliomargarita parva]